jgi:hypothetical protein
LRTIITPRRTIEIGEQAQKPSRAVRTGMKTGGRFIGFSRKNSREKMRSVFINQYRNVGQKHRKGTKNARKSFAA